MKEFIPLSAPYVHGNEKESLIECIDSGWVSTVGPYVDEFEKDFAKVLGANYAVAMNSGTSALHIALLVSGVRKGMEVIIPSVTFIAPANAISYVGAVPVFCDIELNTLQICPASVRLFIEESCDFINGKLINRKSGRQVFAILPIDHLGHPFCVDEILEIARKFNLKIIEDASESLGAKYKGANVGLFGDISCFSFNGNKIITCGGGGMLVTNDKECAERARYLSTQAKDDPYEYFHENIGYNYRLTSIQAAFGRAQLSNLKKCIKKKREIAKVYKNAFSGINGLTFISENENSYSNYWMQVILINEEVLSLNSRELAKKLEEERIQTRPIWQPLSLTGAHKNNCVSLTMPNAMIAYKRGICLPSSHSLTEEQQEKVIDCIIKFIK
ncbi:UNVERIFIED_CONTAM: hypothetical protein GTU68_012246 [Idotea baltica]|nr:hypothetical protein [Idotea baltica]